MHLIADAICKFVIATKKGVLQICKQDCSRNELTAVFLVASLVVVLVEGDLEDVADVSLCHVALGTLLELMNLLHLKMFHASNVVHEQVLAGGVEGTEGAVVGQVLAGVEPLLVPLEVAEEQRGHLMLLIGEVHLQLVGAVGHKVAGVAPQLDGVQAGQEP